MLADSGLNIFYWPLSVGYVTWISNRPPTHTNAGWRLPYNINPDLSAAHRFECPAYLLVEKTKKGPKAGVKMQKLVFIGVSTTQKGWILLDVKT